MGEGPGEASKHYRVCCRIVLESLFWVFFVDPLVLPQNICAEMSVSAGFFFAASSVPIAPGFWDPSKLGRNEREAKQSLRFVWNLNNRVRRKRKPPIGNSQLKMGNNNFM